MIGLLSGRLVSRKPDNVLVDVNGIGYHVHVPLNILSNLPEEGHDVTFHIYTHVREDAINLYGFMSEHDKKTFVALLGITGIGPKMALNILSGVSSDKLMHSVETEDVAMLCRIPGLGKKTAQRLILELKEKLPASSGVLKDTVFEDTLSALMNLGYKKSVSLQAIEKVYRKGSHDIETLLRESLKQLTGDAHG